MRLPTEERNAIVEAIYKFDTAASVYLFGSRTDDAKRGGDIDILVVSDIIDKGSLFLIEEEIFKKVEEQKIDFVLSDSGMNNRFADMILDNGAVRL